MLNSENKITHNKDDILESFANRYEQVTRGEDNEAQVYKKMIEKEINSKSVKDSRCKIENQYKELKLLFRETKINPNIQHYTRRSGNCY